MNYGSQKVVSLIIAIFIGAIILAFAPNILSKVLSDGNCTFQILAGALSDIQSGTIQVCQ